MAWIGKNGKDGKEGKDDCGGGVVANAVERAQLPIERCFVRVSLTGIGEIPAELRAQSDSFWDEVQAMGIVDSATTETNGDTVLTLSVIDEEEARQLITTDPVVAAGLVGSVEYETIA